MLCYAYRGSKSRCLKVMCCCVGYAVMCQMLLYSFIWLLAGIIIVSTSSALGDRFYGVWLGGEASSFVSFVQSFFLSLFFVFLSIFVHVCIYLYSRESLMTYTFVSNSLVLYQLPSVLLQV